MASNPDAASTIEKDIRAQLDELRAQISTLVNEKVASRVAEAKQGAEDAVQHVREAAGCQVAVLSREIRERPFIAVLVAAAVGALIGRLTR
jgi:ElaB/YqjD/DUF883 family membrane-anchored ribosome-binding protein